MITCKQCKKYAKLKMAWKNGLDQIKIAGSCKYCGYDEPVDYLEKGLKWDAIPKSKVTYDSYEELGFED